MKVEVTRFAKQELQSIYDYYSSVASDSVALKVIDKILDEIETLENFPSLGTKEPLLEKLKREHKYLVCGNYKIIFYKTEKVIYVTDIFDCRQNPKRILKRNK